MPNFSSLLKSEISRIAKKEIRAESGALKKSSSQHRSDIAALKRRVAELEGMLRKLLRSRPTPAAEKALSGEKSLRFRVSGFITLRKKLDLSAAEMGQLLGVSAQSVYKWEQGKARPRASQLRQIAQVRKLGKRQVQERLAQAAS